MKNLQEHRPKTAALFYEDNLAKYEEIYATACAVRRHWEACELRASNENRSANAHKFVTGDTRKLVGSIAERDAIPAKDRFLGLIVELPNGDQYVLVGGLSNADYCVPSPKL